MARQRNFGLGSRNIEVAAKTALHRSVDRGDLSYASANAYEERFHQFVQWAKENEAESADREGRSASAFYLESITRELVIEYGMEVAERVRNGELESSYGQYLVSAVNSVLHQIPEAHWRSVSPTRHCHIDHRCTVRQEAPEALNRAVYEQRLNTLREHGSERAVAVCMLARELGLRSKEASLINASKALKEATKTGSVTITSGTKGGRVRTIEISSERQISALTAASTAQGNDRSMIPQDQTWSTWRETELRNAREVMGGLHELRAAYACERYQALTGHAAPCVEPGGHSAKGELVHLQTISEELGHNRIDVVRSYVGSLK